MGEYYEGHGGVFYDPVTDKITVLIDTDNQFWIESMNKIVPGFHVRTKNVETKNPVLVRNFDHMICIDPNTRGLK